MELNYAVEELVAGSRNDARPEALGAKETAGFKNSTETPVLMGLLDGQKEFSCLDSKSTVT